MKELKFKCTLKSDVILNVKSASEGNQQTLDFIPGNNFLGIAASRLYYDENKMYEHRLTMEESFEYFHSGKVCFGDAHPAAQENKDKRTLRVPASMFYPKMKKASELCYIHHFYNRANDTSDDGHPMQLKQCRSGFYAFSDKDKIGYPTKIEKDFAIKSAYDRERRRSKDEAMYGYESLDKGQVFYFSVEIEDDKYKDNIVTALCGERHIGRSRSAQYGLVKIEEFDYSETTSSNQCIFIGEKKYVAIYADSRLIFLDQYGMPTFQPTAQQLGLDAEAEIDWEKSQIRTFQYAPWNFKRQTFDTDRCGIEKGSVFIVACTNCPTESRYVGCYQNEGFGKVIYNPDFLGLAKDAKNGEALYTIEETKEVNIKETLNDVTTPLLKYLDNQQKDAETKLAIYKLVNDFVDNKKSIFKQESFASQWGAIRSYAMQYKTKQELDSVLFTEDTGYLMHGVAQDKWEDRGRFTAFKRFFDGLSNDNAREALINLASQMAKECRKEK